MSSGIHTSQQKSPYVESSIVGIKKGTIRRRPPVSINAKVIHTKDYDLNYLKQCLVYQAMKLITVSHLVSGREAFL